MSYVQYWWSVLPSRAPSPSYSLMLTNVSLFLPLPSTTPSCSLCCVTSPILSSSDGSSGLTKLTNWQTYV